jgi:hypothetical protein
MNGPWVEVHWICVVLRSVFIIDLMHVVLPVQLEIISCLGTVLFFF